MAKKQHEVTIQYPEGLNLTKQEMDHLNKVFQAEIAQVLKSRRQGDDDESPVPIINQLTELKKKGSKKPGKKSGSKQAKGSKKR